jgi:ABC-type branched-subunit amino acid transport system substrate-binding protein
MVKLLYEDKVWAVLGSVDGPNTHIAEQVVTKSWTLLVAPTASDSSLTQINVPWIFRCMPTDQQQALALAEYIFYKKGYKRVAGLAGNDHYGRFGMIEFEKVLRSLISSQFRIPNFEFRIPSYPLALNLKYNPGQTEFSNHLSLIEAAGVEAVVIWGAPEESALFIRQMRSKGMKQAVFGSGLLAVPEFLQATGLYSEGVTVVFPYNSVRNEPIAKRFRENFEAKYAKEPDLFAAYAYDGMRIIIEAVKDGGLNRIKIRDAIAHIEKFNGATGEIRFSANGDNIAEVKLAIVRDGNFCPLPLWIDD